MKGKETKAISQILIGIKASYKSSKVKWWSSL